MLEKASTKKMSPKGQQQVITVWFGDFNFTAMTAAHLCSAQKKRLPFFGLNR